VLRARATTPVAPAAVAGSTGVAAVVVTARARSKETAARVALRAEDSTAAAGQLEAQKEPVPA
jgi:hypothetical protein